MRLGVRKLLRPAPEMLVGLLMAAIVVLTGVTGDNVFARHVGMTVAAPAKMPDSPRDAEQAVSSPTVRQDVGEAPPGAPSSQGAADDDVTHLLHLLGACLFILALSVLLWRRGGWWLLSTRAQPAPFSRLLLHSHWRATARGSPPALAPPRTSPVIRT
jgi:hypothetical protein